MKLFDSQLRSIESEKMQQKIEGKRNLLPFRVLKLEREIGYGICRQEIKQEVVPEYSLVPTPRPGRRVGVVCLLACCRMGDSHWRIGHAIWSPMAALVKENWDYEVLLSGNSSLSSELLGCSVNYSPAEIITCGHWK